MQYYLDQQPVAANVAGTLIGAGYHHEINELGTWIESRLMLFEVNGEWVPITHPEITAFRRLGIKDVDNSWDMLQNLSIVTNYLLDFDYEYEAFVGELSTKNLARILLEMLGSCNQQVDQPLNDDARQIWSEVAKEIGPDWARVLLDAAEHVAKVA